MYSTNGNYTLDILVYKNKLNTNNNNNNNNKKKRFSAIWIKRKSVAFSLLCSIDTTGFPRISSFTNNSLLRECLSKTLSENEKILVTSIFYVSKIFLSFKKYDHHVRYVNFLSAKAFSLVHSIFFLFFF